MSTNQDCMHDKWQRINRTPDADGIDSVVCLEYTCTLCQKILAEESCCISANDLTLIDREWGARHKIEEYMN